MTACAACLIVLLLLAGCGTREASAPRYVCDRLATEGSQPFECVPQAAVERREQATVPQGEVRLVTPNGAVVGQTTIIKPPDSMVVIPAAGKP